MASDKGRWYAVSTERNWFQSLNRASMASDIIRRGLASYEARGFNPLIGLLWLLTHSKSYQQACPQRFQSLNRASMASDRAPPTPMSSARRCFNPLIGLLWLLTHIRCTRFMARNRFNPLIGLLWLLTIDDR